MSARRIFLLGTSLWVRHLQRLIGDHAQDRIRITGTCGLRGIPLHLAALAGSDVILRVGLRPGAPFWKLRVVEQFLATLPARQAFYWIGSDVMRTVRDEKAGRLSPHWMARARASVHLAGAPHFISDLAEIGITAKACLFPSRLPKIDQAPLLPDQFRVLSYIPEGREDFYGWPAIAHAAQRLPDIPFSIMAHSGDGLDRPANLACLGWVKEPLPLYRDAACVVRSVAHDAIGGTVREGLFFGRSVIYSQPHPHTLFMPHNDGEALIALLSALRRDFVPGGPPDAAAHAYAKHTFAEASAVAHLVDCLAAL